MQQSSSTEMMHLREINAVTSAELLDLTMNRIELKAKIKDLEFENRKLELENTGLLNRIDDHNKIIESLLSMLNKHKEIYHEIKNQESWS